ncbi:hypothetical protein D7W81_36600, partial [Corallococcus aberystwythensis]
MRHLDATAMAELTARDAAAVTWFREHLASPCEVCETFLATHTDPLDGRTDALLLALVGDAGERPLEEELERGEAAFDRPEESAPPAGFAGRAVGMLS